MDDFAFKFENRFPDIISNFFFVEFQPEIFSLTSFSLDSHLLRFNCIPNFLASKISGERGDNGRWSSYGFGYDLDWKLNKDWNIGLRANVRSWSERDKFLLPVNLGIGHSFRLSSKISMDAFIGGGPSLVVGNDYAGIFAHLTGGARFNILKLGSKELFTGLYFSQAMAFHPSPFEHMDIVFGIRL